MKNFKVKGNNLVTTMTKKDLLEEINKIKKSKGYEAITKSMVKGSS